MKNRIMIIEDNHGKLLSTKYLLESQLHMRINIIDIANEIQIPDALRSIDPHSVIYKPEGGVVALLQRLQNQKINRRNSCITIVYAAEPLPHHRVEEQPFDNSIARAA